MADLHKDNENKIIFRKDNTKVFGMNCFTQEQVKEINKVIQKNILGFDEHHVIKESVGFPASYTTKTGEFFNIRCSILMKLIHPWLHQCQIINKQAFGYDISWDFHLDMLNYNVYEENDEYGWHLDSNSIFEQDEKLTCLLNLSEEPYEGGEFYTTNGKHKFTSGMGCVFNSLITHKVTPVTKGERITLTYWGSGPSWR